MSKIVTFGTLKGGTGKTTALFCTAGIIAEREYKVLVIDVDPQANITSNFGVDETVKGYKGIKEVFENEDILIDTVITKSPIKELPNLDIIGSCIGLTSAEFGIISCNDREYQLKKYLDKNNWYLKKYDYILIDTNPSMSIINLNCFLISDAIIIVSDSGVNALKGVELFNALWGEIAKNLKINNNVKGLLINKFDKTNSLGQEFLECCKEDEEIREILFNNYFPYDEKIVECELEKKPINLLFKNSTIYYHITSFVSELLNRVNR